MGTCQSAPTGGVLLLASSRPSPRHASRTARQAASQNLCIPGLRCFLEARLLAAFVLTRRLRRTRAARTLEGGPPQLRRSCIAARRLLLFLLLLCAGRLHITRAPLLRRTTLGRAVGRSSCSLRRHSGAQSTLLKQQSMTHSCLSRCWLRERRSVAGTAARHAGLGAFG